MVGDLPEGVSVHLIKPKLIRALPDHLPEHFERGVILAFQRFRDIHDATPVPYPLNPIRHTSAYFVKNVNHFEHNPDDPIALRRIDHLLHREETNREIAYSRLNCGSMQPCLHLTSGYEHSIKQTNASLFVFAILSADNSRNLAYIKSVYPFNRQSIGVCDFNTLSSLSSPPYYPSSITPCFLSSF